jgi:hypothetical protein
MPAEGTLEEQSDYLHRQLEVAHEDIEWAVVLIKYTPGKSEETAAILTTFDGN